MEIGFFVYFEPAVKFVLVRKANMKAKRKIKLLSLLISAVFLVQNASATLPESYHYQGRSYFDYYDSHIDFAVYDTQTYPDQLVGAEGRNEDLPWWDDTDTEENNLDKYRYIYAYQIFLDDESYYDIDYFAILGVGEGSVVKDPSTDKWPIGSMDDLITTGGVAPDDNPYPTSSSEYGQMVVWEFTNGYLTTGDHSWFLVLGSHHDYTYGSYTFDKTVADGTVLPNPEPASIVLLSIGGALAFIRTRKKFRET